MISEDSTATYQDFVAGLLRRLDHDRALRDAVGEEFVAAGKLEYHLLRSLGLSDGQFVVDVGCGSGRLACQLAPFRQIRYLGTDIVPELLDYARKLANREDWRFVRTSGAGIPCDDNAADFVAFFSVFTHLQFGDTFRYLREASRCLKRNGRVVFSFLEFRIPCHWLVFTHSVDNLSPGRPLNQFMDRDAIRFWAEQAGFAEPEMFDGDKGHIPIPEEIVWDTGMRMRSLGNLGQSIAVLRKL